MGEVFSFQFLVARSHSARALDPCSIVMRAVRSRSTVRALRLPLNGSLLRCYFDVAISPTVNPLIHKVLNELH